MTRTRSEQGAWVGLHFMAMEYLLQGPPRTRSGLEEQMLLTRNQPALWIGQLVQQRLMSPIGRDPEGWWRDRSIRYSPNKVIVDKVEYNALRAQRGLDPI